MTAPLVRLAKLSKRIDHPLSLRYDPKDAVAGHRDIPVDVGHGLWIVTTDYPSTGLQRLLDGLAAGRSPREAVKAAERAVDRRLLDAERRRREEDDEP